MSPEGCWAWCSDGSLGAVARGVSITNDSMIYMNQAQVRTLKHARQMVADTHALKPRHQDI